MYLFYIYENIYTDELESEILVLTIQVLLVIRRLRFSHIGIYDSYFAPVTRSMFLNFLNKEGVTAKRESIKFN